MARVSFARDLAALSASFAEEIARVFCILGGHAIDYNDQLLEACPAAARSPRRLTVSLLTRAGVPPRTLLHAPFTDNVISAACSFVWRSVARK